MIEIAEGVYQGAWPDREFDSGWGVVSVAPGPEIICDFRFCCPIEDGCCLSPRWFRVPVGVIEAMRRADKRVYIHCVAGISRSPTLAAAYLVAKGYSHDTALDMVGAVNPNINPAPSFLRALREWQELVRT